LRLRGKGIKSNLGQGDELVHINVRIPEKLNPREKELIEKLGKEFEVDESFRRVHN